MQSTTDISFLEYGNSSSNFFSIEGYPPKTEEKKVNLIKTLRSFLSLGVKTINITCKPGDSEPTEDLVHRIRKEIPELLIIPHISVFSLINGSLSRLLDNYMALGIRNVFLIRGDLTDPALKRKVQSTHAHVLVEEVRKYSRKLCIGVAGYPEQHSEEPNFITALRHLKQKVDVGADYIITQLFFDNKKYFDFLRNCSLFGIHVPIIPGITYLKNKQHIEKISSLALGSSIPYLLMRDVYQNNSTRSLQAGMAWCEQQSKELLKEAKAPLVHFYIFNEAKPFDAIIKAQTKTKVRLIK